MAEESKPVDPTKDPKASTVESDDESGSDGGSVQQPDATSSTASSKKKNKKKKKAKGKEKADEASAEQIAGERIMKSIKDLPDSQLAELMRHNPALLNELRGKDGGSVSSTAQALKGLKLQDLMTGLASSSKNVKDAGSFKFWAEQPVPQFGEKPAPQEGPREVKKIEDISKEPKPLGVEGFRWVTMDLTNEEELAEVEKLLEGHYVEDDAAIFRLKYTKSMLKWSLLTPGWKKQWHVGVRYGNVLAAFISAIPLEIRVRDKVLHSSEVNFLCIRKKLRHKRLAPELIKEITRVCNLEDVWQAIYTGGIILPRPVSSCRYFHRPIDYVKLESVGFCQAPPGKYDWQVRKYKLPTETTTPGLRAMETRDVDAVHELLHRYLKRFDLAPVFTKDETIHWLLNPDNPNEDKVVWSYVVQDDSGKITDFFSFYCLESSVNPDPKKPGQTPKHSSIRAAYLFYYATEAGLTTPFDKAGLKKRLNALMGDALILAMKNKFDVFNALSLMDNALFLEQQKFGPGDGQLHYYLFNYNAKPIPGGVDASNKLDEKTLSGIGFVQL